MIIPSSNKNDDGCLIPDDDFLKKIGYSKRDIEIFKSINNGVEVRDLAIKFNISTTRINQIYRKIYFDIKKSDELGHSNPMLELSVRTFNCLKRAGINNLDELNDCNRQHIRNLGCKSLKEIKDLCDKYNIDCSSFVKNYITTVE